MTPGRLARLTTLVAVGGVSGLAGWLLCRAALAARGALLWDSAAHGVNGLRLAQDLAGGRLLTFLFDINALDHWPFLHPLLLALLNLVAGYGPEPAIALSAGALVGTCVLAYMTACELDAADGTAIGVLAVAGILGGPLMLYYGSLVMLEIFGAFFSLLCVFTYVRFVKVPSPRGAWAVVAATTALCFLKYNYAIFWGVALVGCEIARLSPERRAALRTWLVDWLAIGTLRRPTFWLVAVIVGSILAIRATGGWKGEIAGIRISVTTPGNAVCALLWVLSLRIGYELWKRHDLWKQRLPHEVWAFLYGTMLPLGLWFLVCSPTRVKEFVDWLKSGAENEPQPIMQAMSVYLPAVVEGFAPALWIRIVAAVGFLAGVARAWRGPFWSRVPLAYFAVGALACVTHPYKDPRFLVPIAPAFWIIVACGLCHAAGLIRIAGLRLAALGLLVGVVSVLTALGFPRFLRDEFPAKYAAYYAPSSLEATARAVGQFCERARHVSIFGDCNELSRHALEWGVRRAEGGAEATFESRRARPRPKDIEDGPERESKAFAYWIEHTDADAVIAVEVPPTSPLFGHVYPTSDVAQVEMLKTQTLFPNQISTTDPDTKLVVRVYRRK